MSAENNKDLSVRKQNILLHLAESEKINKFSLSIRELGVAVGTGSTGAINDNLKFLEKSGLITTVFGMSRSAYLTEEGREYITPAKESQPVEE